MIFSLLFLIILIYFTFCNICIDMAKYLLSKKGVEAVKTTVTQSLSNLSKEAAKSSGWSSWILSWTTVAKISLKVIATCYLGPWGASGLDVAFAIADAA